MPDDEKHTDADAAQTARDLSALQDAGYDTDDAGRGNKAMSERDVSDLTGDTSEKAAEAGHVARDDMAAAGDMGVPADRHSR